jgi:hypothetical protein
LPKGSEELLAWFDGLRPHGPPKMAARLLLSRATPMSPASSRRLVPTLVVHAVTTGWRR